METEQTVTVVVPTFNRAHILEQTITSYLQPEVKEVIVVDDASTDHTQDVLRHLSGTYPDRIRILRNPTNSKQTVSKNRGKELATTPWVYFGDDDSVITPGTIARLLASAERQGADVVAAVALYCQSNETPEDAIARFENQAPTQDGKAFVDLVNLRFDFALRPGRDLEMPVTQACFLIRKSWYERIHFDTRFTGNCYREETDFTLSCHAAGARVILCSDAHQVNLPRRLATGGARSGSRARYEWSSFMNTARFLAKHRDFYRDELGIRWVFYPLVMYTLGKVRNLARRILR